jgi:uncharacterized membrane protein YcaP (DUF421 family)
MESLIRTAAVYAVLLLLFRVIGRRMLGQLTNFDFVLLLIIGEAVQNALLANDYSMTNALVSVLTILALDIFLSLLKQKSPVIERVTEGLPFVIVDHGKLLEDRLDRARVDSADILEAARMKMGLERIEQIKYAVLEKTGEISIIPMDKAR